MWILLLMTQTLTQLMVNDVIKSGLVAQIRMLNVSDDVIYQSLYKSVYSVSGIESAVITIGGTLVELD
jgi:hypothetical protein